ncbi:MAG: hypothetical protein QOK29_444, partial [Rhodospirillaceae bacterium]|nr:hypothetical protein [Rhodospirillaceae bacterium]
APSREEKVIRLDGKEIEVEVTAAPFEDRGERAIVVILRDVTAKRSTEQQLRQAQKMEAVGQLTGGIAHDFNNLLGVIIGNLELALDMPEDTRRVDAHLQIAIDSALRGAELTHRLLAFARKQPLHPRAFVVNNVLPDTIAILQRTIGAAISIRTSLGDGLWEAFADLSPLQDAVINLAINARDAMPKGGTLTLETANVHLDEQYARNHPEVRPGEYVMLAVTDTGTGMPPEIVERVLEPFFTTKEVGKGTGLGLSMVYGFAKQSGGHLKIYSEVGFGTSVKLYLPRALESATTPSPGVAVQHPLPRGSETILIAEDNPDLRKMAVEQLLSLGYRVFEADNGESALAILRGSETLDLLFTEIVMTGQMTGYELVQEAKKLRPDVHILHTTGYAGSAATNGNAGERHFLNKPYRKLDLAVKLRHVLEQAPSRD